MNIKKKKKLYTHNKELINEKKGILSLKKKKIMKIRKR